MLEKKRKASKKIMIKKNNLELKSDDNFYLKARKYLIDILFSKIIISPKAKILDIGSNTGVNIPILKKYGEVYAIDINKKNISLAKKHDPKETKIMDATNLKYPNKFFDVVCIFDVLEHIPNHKKAVKEIQRVLKKEGYCFVGVPAFNFLFSSHDRAVGHQRRYNPKELDNLFQNFKIIFGGFWNFLFFFPICILRLVKKSKNTGKEDCYTFNKVINNLMFQLLNLENIFIRNGINFPIGISIYRIYKAKK